MSNFVYKISNNTNQNISIDGIVLSGGLSTFVKSYSDSVQQAIEAGTLGVERVPNPGLPKSPSDLNISQIEEALGNSVVLSVSMDLTAADLGALATETIDLIPAQGAGKIVIPQQFFRAVKLNGGLAPLQTGNIYVVYKGDADNNNANGLSDTTLDNDDGYTDETFSIIISNTSTQNIELDNCVNKAVVLWSDGNDLQSLGALQTAVITTAGSGYQVNDEVTVNDATIKVLTVDGGGAVLTFSILDAGVQSYKGTNIAASDGNGTGLIFDITEVDYSVNPMILTVGAQYSVIEI